eukprot:1989097-Prymnesium_polylepis.1
MPEVADCILAEGCLDADCVLACVERLPGRHVERLLGNARQAALLRFSRIKLGEDVGGRLVASLAGEASVVLPSLLDLRQPLERERAH